MQWKREAPGGNLAETELSAWYYSCGCRGNGIWRWKAWVGSKRNATL